ncbi:membrane-bound alpha-1,6- mannosyltransferase Initiation-specific [Trebouxia sp. C0010 RCD-2024]
MLNPDYQVKVMGDEERTQMVAAHAPGLLAVYTKLKPTERNDFWSYLTLYLFGGWYVDHDVKCVKPFDKFAANFNGNASAIVGIEAVLKNEANRNKIGFCCPVQYCHWVMGSAPGHVLFGHVVDLILDFQIIAAADPNSAPGKQKDIPVVSTGPGILTKAVEHFMALFDVYTVDVALKAPEMIADLGVMPATAVAAGGYGTEDNTPELVYVRHMFAGTWKHGNSGSW